MLRFEETKQHYKISEYTHTFYNTRKMQVTYSKDLRTKQVNKDPVQLTTKEDRDWFEKYYREKF